MQNDTPTRKPAPGDRPSGLVRWGYPVMGALLVALYARTVASGPTFSDGPEIVTAMATLGVIHPTGYPLFTIVGHLFIKLLPLDVQPCVKISLLNALFAGGAAIFTAHIARSVAWAVKPGADGERVGRPGADIAGLFAGTLLGTAPLLWDQVRIPEVYPFHLFLASWALYGLIRFEITRRRRLIVMSGLAIGLGLAHHVTMVYMLPAGILYTLVREPSLLYGPFILPVVKIGRLIKKGFWQKAKTDGAWVFPVVLVVGFVPAVFYGYILWANKHTTGLNWGGVSDWDGLYFHATGKQYSKFMELKDIGVYLGRLGRLPDAFDKQFLTTGTILLVPGVYAAFRRAWRPALLLLLVMLFYIGHGVYYSVGDYHTYFLPAVMALAVFLGVGMDAALRWAAERAPEKRLLFTVGTAALVLATASLSVLYYALATKRFPGGLQKVAVPGLVLPLGVLAVAAGVAAFVLRRRAEKGQSLPPWRINDRLYPGLLLASAALPLLPVTIARVDEMDDRHVIGESYGRELMENAPPGSVVMVQGDGFLFTLWYQTHVMNRGTDAAILDVGTLGAQWYKKYLTTRYPEPCDPLAPEHVRDRAAYEAKCKTFRQRIDLGATTPWVTMGDRRSRGITAAERQKGSAIVREAMSRTTGRLPRLPQGDPRCELPDFRKGHSKECRCWFEPKRDAPYNEDCVFSPEEGGIVPRERVEIWLHHLVEEHIDERPLFERNLFTSWQGNARENPRGWSGPQYQRISGEFALVNRGRANQILYATEVSGPAAEACGPTRKRLDIQRRGPQKPPPKEGRPYRPNEWPTLITASYLTRAGELGDDNARREFTAGEEVRLQLDWFEKNRFDPFAKDKKGSPIRHGVRICVFDGDGQKLGQKDALSLRPEVLGFKIPADSKGGEHHIAACTVGEVGDVAKYPDDMPCERLILEYPFTVKPRQ